MKRSAIPVAVSAGASVALVVAALVLVRGIGASAYDAYRARGGENGFWTWFAKDACGAALSGGEEENEARRRAAKNAEGERRTKLEELKARITRLEAEEKAALARMKKKASKKIGQGKSDAKRRNGKTGKRGGPVKTGVKSSFVAGTGKSPYRVNGIRGIEFGSTENAPADGALPLMSVSYDADGNEVFQKLRWREDKPLTDSVYGFDRAWLNHTYETEQLATVTFHKSFPFTEAGMAQAVAFYNSMSAEASADLGFDVVDIDRTGNGTSATICEFRNGDGDTSIRGTISAWSDKHLTVTFSVSDKAYSQALLNQSNDAYDSGVADSVKARIERVGPYDYSARMERAADYLE